MKSNGLSLRFQCATLAATLLIIFYLIGHQVQGFCTVDKTPRIFSVTPRTLTGITVSPAVIKAGFTVTDFPEFSVTDNRFKITGIIWFTFDQALISLETVGNFSFLRGDIEFKSNPLVVQEGDLLTVRYAIRVAFKTNLYFGFFPFEDHAINLVLVNDSITPFEGMYEVGQSDFILTEDVYISGWDYHDRRVVTGFSTIPLGQQETAKRPIESPAILFQIDFFQHNARYIISVLLPLLIIFLIDLFSLCLDQKDDHAVLVQISTGNMVALLAYRFVIESISPKVGYAMLADYLFFLFLFNSFIIFVVNCVAPYATLLQKKLFSIADQAVVLGVFVYLFTQWVPC